jgi:MbtH protein
MRNGDEDGGYTVVVNQEEQYSVWPVGRECPRGWWETGFRGAKEECLEHIKGVWTDMRPLSLRRAITDGNRSAKRPNQARPRSTARRPKRPRGRRQERSES